MLNQIISGTISGLIVIAVQILIQRHLARRIKKLEEREKRKNEQEEYKGLSKMLIIFKKMHIDNSKQSAYYDDPKWREIIPNGETNEEYNLAFRIVRK
jgi:demethoxyubiquinone hydroxylase (CLK1/Coq7/Cat5 family)